MVITNLYPPHHLGGYELACRDAVRRWREHGHDVQVLTSTQRFPGASVGEEDEQVRRELSFYWRDGLVVSPSLRERLRIERANRAVLLRTLEETSPDVVSIWHMGAMSLSLLTEIEIRRIPMVLVVYDDWLVYGPTVDAWTRLFRSRRWAAAGARTLFGVQTTVGLDGSSVAACFMSDWIRQRAESRSPMRLPKHRAVVYGGIDLATFSPREKDSSFGWRLLCAGRVEKRKGVHVAVEAMSLLPDQAVLDVVGSWEDESYADGLRQRAEELGMSERVRLRGQTDREGLARALREADIFLFPVTWEEPFGMAPLEAMACGTAVVGTGTGGSSEFLLDEVNCLRVPKDDPEAMGRAVLRLASDDVFRERVTKEGVRTAEVFGLDRYIDELEAWHVAATEGFAGGTPDSRPPLREILGL